jgi:hypothetical protein
VIRHTVGSCYVSGSDVYVHIPKCASTSLKDTLRWEYSPRPVAGRAFAVVRDPVDRWFSGVRQFVVRNGGDYDDLLDQVEAGRSPVFDEHTWRQTDFLEPFDGVELVRVESVSGFVEDRFGVVLPVKNESEWRRRESLVPLIEEFYVGDAELYEAAV